jgi:hypothetical protein
MVVDRDGRRASVDLEERAVNAYAAAAAKRFGVGADRQATFMKERAKADLKPDDKKKRA